MKTDIILLLALLVCFANGFFFLNLTLTCIKTLPYGYTHINIDEYQTWYGKVGEQLNGTNYLYGHAITKHVAVNGKCTDEQLKDNKTVFLDLSFFYKTLSHDTTDCTLTSEKAFNFNQHHVITDPSNYITGIDCKTQQTQTFTKYFIQFKKAIQNSHPTQEQYMASQSATVWTFYPQRA